MVRSFILAGVVLLAAVPAYAGETPLYQAAPDWVVPASFNPAAANDIPSGSVVVDEQQRVDAKGTWFYFDSVTRITSAEMLGRMGTITLPWHPSKGDLIVHRAQIIRAGQTIDLLAKGTKLSVLRREEQLEQQELTGILTATLTVEGLQVGDLFRISFSVTRSDPALAGHVDSQADLLADPKTTQFGRFRMIWPKATPLQWRTYGKLPEVRPTAKGDLNELVITLPLAKQPDIPADAPPRFRHDPLIEASSFVSWNEVSRTAAPLYKTDGLIVPGSSLAKEVARIAAAEQDPRKRAALALRLVQDQVRYLFVGLGDGDYVPQAPARTWEVRYGDCKAKTLLLLAILHALDIKAEPVLANIGLGDWLPERLPSFGAFNHVFVRAEVGGKTLWLDGTTLGTRLDDLEDTPPFRYVLPVLPGGGDLTPIVTVPPARPQIAIDLELDQSAGLNFPAPYKAAVTFRGPTAETLRLGTSQASAEQLTQMVTAVMKPFIGSGSVVTRSVAFDADAGTATIHATGLANAGWNKENQRYAAMLDRLVSDMDFSPDRARPEWQKIPVVLPYPVSVTEKLRIHLPNGGTGFSLSGDSSINETLAGIDLARTSSLQGEWLTVDQTMATRDAEIPAERIPAMKERVTLARDRALRMLAPQDYPERWTEIDAGRTNKRFDAILALLDKDIAQNPQEVGGYRNRAAFLASIYERKRAVADLDQILKLRPDVGTYQWRSQLRSDLGDTDGALADLMEARKLDPGADGALYQLAELRSERGDIEGALKLIDPRIEAGGKERPHFMAAKANILGRAGRIEEGLKLLDDAIAEAPGDPMLLNNRCWFKGTHNLALDTALKDCTKAIELADSPAPALDSRGMVYFRMRRFDDALADLNAAEAARTFGATLFMRGIVRHQMGDRTGGDSDLAAAHMMAPQVEADYAKFGIKP